MSDTSSAEGTVPTAGAGVADSGAPAGDSGVTEATPEPPSYLDTDEYAGHHVRVRVDGEEIEVPLSEALQGYSRTQDYTRKTQALAEQQRSAQFGLTLQEALANNPEATIRLLQDQYGVAAANQMVADAQGDDDDDGWLDDPVEQRLSVYEQRLAEQEQYRADQELRVALRVLQQRYGEDFQPQEVVNRAVATGRMDLEAIHKEMMFDRYYAQQQATRETEAKRAAEDQARQQAAAGVTAHSGGGVPGGAVAIETPQPMTIAEAYAQAKQQHGLA
jgi:hypothetical protein